MVFTGESVITNEVITGETVIQTKYGETVIGKNAEYSEQEEMEPHTHTFFVKECREVKSESVHILKEFMDEPQTLIDKVKKTLENRTDKHGNPERNFTKIARLWNAYLFGDEQKILPKDVAMMQMLLKIARVSTGVNHSDNYVDICGYATLAEEMDDGSDGWVPTAGDYID